jgi:hypothetical protein
MILKEHAHPSIPRGHKAASSVIPYVRVADDVIARRITESGNGAQYRRLACSRRAEQHGHTGRMQRHLEARIHDVTANMDLQCRRYITHLRSPRRRSA